MSRTIFMIRHGQTDWNAMGRLQGQANVPMNEHGRGQVRRNAEKLAAMLADPDQYRYVTSPIERAVETMHITRAYLGSPNRNVHQDPRLMELNYGEFAGNTWDELRKRRVDSVERRFEDSWSYVCPDGECYAMLAKRVFDWLDEVEEDTIVTAHAGVSRVLQSRYMQVSREKVAFLKAPQDRILVIGEDGIDWI